MADTVFILGAGASKQGGAPLMANFLDVAESLLRKGEVGSAAEDFRLVFEAIAKLHVVHSKSELDLTNIESTFAAFEMGQTLSRLPGTTTEEIPSTIAALKRVIAKTIEVTLRFPASNERGVLPPKPYGNFVTLLRYLQNSAHPPHTVAVLTFNYDLAMDFACHHNNIPIHYGIEDRQPSGALPVLKLHGSLNWGTCEECGHVVPWTLPDFLGKFRWDPHRLPSSVTLDISSRFSHKQHCGKKALAPEPVIVPPTWNKGEYHSSLSRVWARAAKELSEAENIFVCGYSLPDSDAFFRHLYALGTVGERPLRRFWVCDPDTSGLVRDRFEALLGLGARRRFEHKSATFSDALGLIKSEFPERANS